VSNLLIYLLNVAPFEFEVWRLKAAFFDDSLRWWAITSRNPIKSHSKRDLQ